MPLPPPLTLALSPSTPHHTRPLPLTLTLPLPPNGAGRNSRPEYEVALSQGFKLEEPLGSGHYGRVYRGRNTATGQVGEGSAGHALKGVGERGRHALPLLMHSMY